MRKDQQAMMSDEECWPKGVLEELSDIDYSQSIPITLQIHKLIRVRSENGPVHVIFFELLNEGTLVFFREYVSNQRSSGCLSERE